MSKDVSLVMCLNCNKYAADSALNHRLDCGTHVVVEVVTQRVGVYCLKCNTVYDAEPGSCTCGHSWFEPVYKQPTLSHMEAVIHLLIDALAKSHDERPERPMRAGAGSGG